MMNPPLFHGQYYFQGAVLGASTNMSFTDRLGLGKVGLLSQPFIFYKN